MSMHNESDHAPGCPDSAYHAPGCPDSAYHAYCSTLAGDLQGFEERPQRLTQWSMRQDELDRAAERAARDYMRARPVWRDYPALR